MANLEIRMKILNAFANVATQERSSCWTVMIATAGSMVCVPTINAHRLNVSRVN